jgi:hypothetical protein
VLISSGLNQPLDVVVNPVNHLVYVSNSGRPGITVDNPTTHGVSTLTGTGADGLTISADGSTVYGASGGHILGWDTTTGNQVFDSGAISVRPSCRPRPALRRAVRAAKARARLAN